MTQITIQRAFNLAARHYQAGRLREADQLYRQILAQQPEHADAMHYLGVVASQTGRHDAAVDLIRRAIALGVNSAEAHSNLGNSLKNTGRVAEAIAACRQAIILNPNYAEAHNNLGVALKEKGQLDEAVAACQAAIALRPNFPEAHCNLGYALKANGKLDEAIAAYRAAIALRPDYAEALSNLGNALKEKGQFDEAIASCRAAIALKPEFPEAHCNLGNALKDTGQLEEAIAAYRRAIALKPGFPEAHSNLGNALRDNGQVDEAIVACREAITLNPSFPDGHLNLAFALLSRGDFQQGWDEYEWRWKCKDLVSKRNFAQPHWDGSPLDGRTILLHAEQGFGDTLQFIRYLPLVAERGGRIIIECQPALQRLLKTLAQGCQIVAQGQPLPAFDVHCPLLSLPRVFGTTADNLPKVVPYLRADPADASRWQQLLADSRAVKVGLIWAGSPTHKNDRNRSIRLAMLAPLGQVHGARFFSLQIGEAAVQARTPPAGIVLVDKTGELKDFADTAALIANLDLVIAVDTAVVHLAGAMGKPVWTLLPFVPDWRWLLEREDCPWYPSMRLFRQPARGDWESVINRVAAELSVLIKGGAQFAIQQDNALDKIGRLDETIAVRRQAIALRPSDAEAHNKRGMALKDKGQFDEAIAAYRQAIALRPGSAEVHNNLGIALKNNEQIDEAIAAYRQAIALRPDYAEAQCNLGNALKVKGQLDEAIAACRAAIALNPNLCEPHNNLGNALKEKGQLDEAIAAYRQAIALNPKLPEAHSNFGNALKEKGRFDEAIAACQAAIALRPGYAEAHCNLGNALKGKGQLDAAIAAYHQAIAVKPNYAEAYNNLGVALKDKGQLDQAITALQQAITLSPNYAEARSNLGNVLKDQGQLDEAIAACQQAIAIKSDLADGHLNLALALLARGDFQQGWDEYEWRWKCKDLASARNYSQPQWDGGPLEGRTILLHAEQGFGDTLQFIRYLPLVARRGGKIILECPVKVQRLLETMAEGCQIVAQGQSLPAFDLHCALLSLPRVFETTSDNLPAAVPYLQAKAGDARKWRRLLADHSRVVKVGLVWAGNSSHKNDRNRSMKLATLAPLGQVPGVRFFSLQMGEASSQAKAPPAGMELIDWTHDLKDFADTAALLANLDLVIAVDTAVVHLAGAMGKPVWTLLALVPDWRWLVEREDSPWYPTMRLFRQPSSGDWDSVIHRVVDALSQLITIEQAFELAVRHHQGGRLPEARQHYRKILDRQPEHAGATHYLGVIANQTGQHDVAVDLIRRAIALGANAAEAHHNLGITLKDRGQLDEAVAAFRQAIALRPNYAEAHNSLGIALKDRGQLDEAITACRAAIALQPNFPEAHNNLAIALKSTGQFDEAIAAYRQAVALRPNYADVHCNLGNALRDKGQFDEAVAACRAAIAINPRFAEAHSNLGNALKDEGQVDEAISAYRQAIVLKPNFSEAHGNLGCALQDKGQFDEAIAAHRQAIALKPNSPEAHNSLGVALAAKGQFDQAIAAYRQAIALKPNYPQASSNLGCALQDSGLFDEAAAACRAAIALKPNLPEAHCNLGNALKGKGQVDEAIAAYQQAIALRPTYAEAHNNLGVSLKDKGQLDEAITALQQAIALRPDYANCHYNLALTLLTRGDLQPGWEEHEWRWKWTDFPSPRRNFPQPLWDGSPLDGRTILLHAEQGFGDTIQFIRYLPLVAERGGKIILECQMELERLLRKVAEGCQIVTRGQPLPAFDLHCPLLSLPRVFGTTLSNLPAGAPYLKADAGDARRWRQLLASDSQIMKVGLAWAGNPSHKEDRNRSMKPATLAPLGRVQGVRFFSLQIGKAADKAKAPPAGMELVDWTEQLKDFADTAALIANLDLVIAVDTAVAHLAGAMGKPVWTLLPFAPDWRWLLEREDNPWYPTMRLFRQHSSGDWDSVINRVVSELSLWINA